MPNENKTKDRILRSATELFVRYGFMKTSLEDIARGAQITKATIYYYFPSKEDIFLEAIRVKAEELFSNLASSIAAAPSFGEKLFRFLRLPLKYIYENMPILAEAMHQIPGAYFQKLEENRADYRSRMNALLAGILDQGKASGIINPRIDSERFSALVNDWFLMGDTWTDPGDKHRIVERIERDHDLIIDLILYGIVMKDEPAANKNKAIPKRKNK